MPPVTNNNVPHNAPKAHTADDFISIQDLLRLCLAKWKWFVLSLAVCLCVAAIYLLSTPPVYTRSASILIKTDSKGQSVTDAAGVLGNVDIFQTNTNVNNELISMQSPSIMLDVVKRLNLYMNYATEGNFYRRTLYGSALPVKVTFLDLQDNETATMTMHPAGAGRWQLSDFTRNGSELNSPENLTATTGMPVTTPVGKVLIEATGEGKHSMDLPIYVSRTTLLGATASCSSRLTAGLNSEDATVIDLSYQDVNTQRAEDVLNTLIAVYNENWVKDKNQIAVSTSMFINERLGVIEQELGHVDENISSYKSANLLPDVQAASNLYMSQSSETSAKILDLNTQLSMARYIRSYMTASGNRNQLLPANTGLQGGNVEQQIGEYNAMQLQRNNLVANSSDKNPLVTDMDQSLTAMHEAIITSIDNLIVSLNTQISGLERSEQQTTARIAANPSQAKHLLSVERQQKVKEQLYLFLLQKREENELSQAFTAYNTRIITPPTGSFLPTAPVKKNILLVAIALGILFPVVVIFIRENMNTKVRGRKDLENLSLPFVGEVPLVSSNPQKKGTAEDKRIIIKPGCRDMVNEAFRVLRTNMEFILDAGKDDRASVLLFTSFNPGSGKTFLTINTAATFALKGKRVLVIDGDMRHGSASAYMDRPAKGLSDYLGKREDSLDNLIKDNSDYPNLHLLPAGTIPPNPTELLAEPRFKALIEELRGKYDYIFIDCPPIDIVADTQIIEKQTDRTLFVVRAGLLERGMLPELQRMYDEKRFKNMAIILNGTECGHGRYGYKYGYKDYYDSGKK